DRAGDHPGERVDHAHPGGGGPAARLLGRRRLQGASALGARRRRGEGDRRGHAPARAPRVRHRRGHQVRRLLPCGGPHHPGVGPAPGVRRGRRRGRGRGVPQPLRGGAGLHRTADRARAPGPRRDRGTAGDAAMSTAGPLTAHRPERVAVVIPAKNEAERIEATIFSARRIPGVDLVVVVDDGSTDATSAVAMGAGALVVRHKSNRGKAAAMATGAQLVAIREGAERPDAGESFPEELHAEPREPGHTGPLRVIGPGEAVPRAMLFLDAYMGDSAEAAQPLVDAVHGEGVDMEIALLPPQAGASGMGIVVRTSRRGIQRATGWEPTQPLSGTRCITRETWEACLPLAPGWGVETSLTIDALTAGFWVKEIPAELHHRATGKDLRGQLHRAAQLRDVVRALARKRHLAPDLQDPDLDAFERSTLEEPE